MCKLLHEKYFLLQLFTLICNYVKNYTLVFYNTCNLILVYKKRNEN